MIRPDYDNTMYELRSTHCVDKWNVVVGEMESLASRLNDYIDYLEQQLDAAPKLMPTKDLPIDGTYEYWNTGGSDGHDPHWVLIDGADNWEWFIDVAMVRRAPVKTLEQQLIELLRPFCDTFLDTPAARVLLETYDITPKAAS